MIKKSIAPYVAKMLSSDQLKHARRSFYATKRQVTKQEPTLDVFLKPDDPYSYLLMQVIESLAARFNVKFEFHTFLDIDPEMYPKLAMWRTYAFYDAGQIAQLYGLSYPERQPEYDQTSLMQAAGKIAELEHQADFIQQALPLFHKFWSGQPELPGYSSGDVSQGDLARLAENAQLLRQKGHYLGAMIHFEGEWYWGIDRLDHLEKRLIHQGLARNSNEKVTFDQTYQDFSQQPTHSDGAALNQSLTLFWSARSPYSYIGLERAIAMAERYGIPLNIKPVMPMMMRGLNVPPTKKMYIFHDTKREAQKLGLPYGFVADPLGPAVERCYALVDYARSENRLHAFLLSFARGVNAEGIRAETDRGLKTIVERCGLDWETARQKLHNESWREWVEQNLEDMMAAGCWGVPSLRYGDTQFWGQDRFGLVERMIREDLERQSN